MPRTAITKNRTGAERSYSFRTLNRSTSKTRITRRNSITGRRSARNSNPNSRACSRRSSLTASINNLTDLKSLKILSRHNSFITQRRASISKHEAVEDLSSVDLDRQFSQDSVLSQELSISEIPVTRGRASTHSLKELEFEAILRDVSNSSIRKKRRKSESNVEPEKPLTYTKNIIKRHPEIHAQRPTASRVNSFKENPKVLTTSKPRRKSVSNFTKSSTITYDEPHQQNYGFATPFFAVSKLTQSYVTNYLLKRKSLSESNKQEKLKRKESKRQIKSESYGPQKVATPCVRPVQNLNYENFSRSRNKSFRKSRNYDIKSLNLGHSLVKSSLNALVSPISSEKSPTTQNNKSSESSQFTFLNNIQEHSKEEDKFSSNSSDKKSDSEKDFTPDEDEDSDFRVTIKANPNLKYTASFQDDLWNWKTHESESHEIRVTRGM